MLLRANGRPTVSFASDGDWTALIIYETVPTVNLLPTRTKSKTTMYSNLVIGLIRFIVEVLSLNYGNNFNVKVSNQYLRIYILSLNPIFMFVCIIKYANGLHRNLKLILIDFISLPFILTMIFLHQIINIIIIKKNYVPQSPMNTY